MRPVRADRSAAFAKRLKALMDERGLNQSDLAAKMWGRHTSSEGKYVAKGRDRISVWLARQNFPDEKNLALLAKALDVKRTELVTDAEVQAIIRTEPAASMVLYPGGKALCVDQSNLPVRDRPRNHEPRRKRFTAEGA